jgi:hypothetical protein
MGSGRPGGQPWVGRLGKGVADHQPVDPSQHRLLGLAGGVVQLLQQSVEFLVVAALTGQDAARASELLDGLVGDRTGHGSASGDGGGVCLPSSFPAGGRGMRLCRRLGMRGPASGV